VRIFFRADELDGGDGMMTRKTLVALIVLGMLLFGAIHPPRARAASFDTTPLIISLSIAGALGLITFIAILASSDDDEPQFLAEVPRPRDREPGIHLGFQATRFCPPVGGNINLACW
jgi:hypothetical protein